jgi:DNA-binding NarL/FixJ family response regulator
MENGLAVQGDGQMRRPTETELRVLELIAQGRTDIEIGEKLNITRNTVRTHTSNLLRAMKVHTRAHAVAEAICRGWIDC